MSFSESSSGCSRKSERRASERIGKSPADSKRNAEAAKIAECNFQREFPAFFANSAFIVNRRYSIMRSTLSSGAGTVAGVEPASSGP